MPYNQYTLADFTSYIQDLLDDTDGVYWPTAEVQYATFEGLRVWGSLTNYWRARGIFNLNPAQPYPYYDLSVVLPGLRTRTVTLNEIVKSIQYMLLEAANGISGVGMSGQLPVGSILDAIQYARNRFILDTHLPLSIHQQFGNPPSPQGTVTYSASTVFLHRASWMDSTSGTWTNLWREDEWSMDKGYPKWPTSPGAPVAYSEADLAPLQLQLFPAPINAGQLDALTVDSLEMDITNPATTFQMPDEWVYAIKYGALSNILSGGMIDDDMREQYSEQRYQQAVEFAKDARSILRLQCNSNPLNLDALDSLDAGAYAWRNQSGTPIQAGALYDIVAFSPGMPDQAYGIAADVVQTAPIPSGPFDPTLFYMPMGPEDLDNLVDYVCHILLFKCGGTDFKSTMGGYDNFMRSVANRKAINAAKIRYMSPLFGQPQKEWQLRPDKKVVSA